jgi:VWFA-related protein
MKKASAILFSMLALGPAAWWAARAQDEPVIRVDVELVNLFFTARDKSGTYLRDLTRDALTVFEDGKQQEIKNFSRESDLPLTIGLLVDVSGSQQQLIPEERNAASRFFREVLRKKDLAFLISFGSEVEELQDYTGSPQILERALGELRLSRSFSGLGGPIPTSGSPKGTLLFDSVYLAADEKLKGEVGRKVLVLITDGVDQGSHYKVQQAIDAAQKADAIIYSIYYSDPQFGVFGGGSDGDLKKMSEETGGRVFHVGRNETLSRIFSQIQEEMRSQYTLAYSASNDKKDGSFRKIEIRPKDKNVRILARKGYFADAK